MLERKKIDRDKLPDVLVAKWGSEVLSEGYTPMPKRLIRCLPRLFKGRHALEHLAVILAVVDYRRPRINRPPSVEYLAFIAGMTVEKLKTRLDELRELNWITFEGVDAALDVDLQPLIRKIISASSDE